MTCLIPDAPEKLCEFSIKELVLPFEREKSLFLKRRFDPSAIPAYAISSHREYALPDALCQLSSHIKDRRGLVREISL